MHHERWRNSGMHLLRSSDPSLTTMRVDRSHGNLNMKENESLGGWTAMTRFRIGIPVPLLLYSTSLRTVLEGQWQSLCTCCTNTHTNSIRHTNMLHKYDFAYACLDHWAAVALTPLRLPSFATAKRRNSNEELTSRLGLRTQKGAWAWPRGKFLRSTMKLQLI
jgi:hypothetical protein